MHGRMHGCVDAGGRWFEGWMAGSSLAVGGAGGAVAHNFPGFKTYFEKLWAQVSKLVGL